jgi:signal transduction histidine kinase
MTLRELIESHREWILDEWSDAVGTSVSARGLSRPELHNLIPAYLTLLARAPRAASTLTDEQKRLIENHLSHRLRQGYELNEVLAEFARLGTVIAALIDQQPVAERPAAVETAELFAELFRTSTVVSRIFTEHLLEDEQRDKRYARLIANIAEEALRQYGRAPPLSGRLNDVVALIAEAMQAQTVSLLLVDGDEPDRLIAVASTGLADEAVAHYTTAIGSDSFAGRLAVTGGEPLEVFDVATGDLDVSDNLRTSGIHSLLGVRLPARHTLRGVLYVGVTQKRQFTASELRQLASLGDRLTLHLDNAHLVAELRAKVSAVQMFVDVLAHDLRGPIASARLAASVAAESAEMTARMLPRIMRGLDRADRMITDLLDAHRVQAGERLPLTMTAFDLVGVARDVVEDLEQQYPGRVQLRSPDALWGTGCSPYLRRALWNLVINGLKYGDAKAPVVIDLSSRLDRVALAVHNDGPPISVAEQQRFFRMFSRGRELSGGSGWGLGLALVRGAAEAHGGTVDITSDAESGTTFTVEIPWTSAARAADGHAAV